MEKPLQVGLALSFVAMLALFVYPPSVEELRPSEEDAIKHFNSRYPGVEIVSVKISEDEVVARSFDIRYRTAGSKPVETSGIQFMSNGNKTWVVSPQLPERLP